VAVGGDAAEDAACAEAERGLPVRRIEQGSAVSVASDVRLPPFSFSVTVSSGVALSPNTHRLQRSCPPSDACSKPMRARLRQRPARSAFRSPPRRQREPRDLLRPRVIEPVLFRARWFLARPFGRRRQPHDDRLRPGTSRGRLLSLRTRIATSPTLARPGRPGRGSPRAACRRAEIVLRAPLAQRGPTRVKKSKNREDGVLRLLDPRRASRSPARAGLPSASGAGRVRSQAAGPAESPMAPCHQHRPEPRRNRAVQATGGSRPPVSRQAAPVPFQSHVTG